MLDDVEQSEDAMDQNDWMFCEQMQEQTRKLASYLTHKWVFEPQSSVFVIYMPNAKCPFKLDRQRLYFAVLPCEEAEVIQNLPSGFGRECMGIDQAADVMIAQHCEILDAMYEDYNQPLPYETL
jgi:hypothetical protein